jgi:hypothetical protein
MQVRKMRTEMLLLNKLFANVDYRIEGRLMAGNVFF